MRRARQQARGEGQARALIAGRRIDRVWARGCRHRPVSLSEQIFLVRAGAELLLLEPNFYSGR